MSGMFAPFLNLRSLPPGRIVFAHKEVLAKLPPDTPDQVRHFVEMAVSDNQEAFRLRQRYEEHKRGGVARGRAAALDPEISGTVSGIYSLMVGLTTGVDEGDEMAKRAREVLSLAFSGGVAAIVQVPFEIQVATVNDLLAKFAPPSDGGPGGPLHEHVEPLNLAARLARLDKQNKEFAGELATRSERVSLEQVDAAFQKGQQSHHRAFVQILAAYSEDTPEHIALRTRLVAPIIFQNERVREHHRRSRNVSEVNPETGEESNDG